MEPPPAGVAVRVTLLPGQMNADEGLIVPEGLTPNVTKAIFDCVEQEPLVINTVYAPDWFAG